MVVIPIKMPHEKADALRLLGATIVRSLTSAAFIGLDGLVRVAHNKLLKDPENTIILDQVRKFVKFVENQLITIFVLSIVTNIRKLKQALGDKCRIIAADPSSSNLSLPESLNETDV